MKSEIEMKYFKAVTYNGEEYNFAVTPENEIYCIEFGMTIPASIIELKPNFVLRNNNRETIYSLDEHLRNRSNPKNKGDKIYNWIIEPDVFEYLTNNKMVMFSKQMAILYGFAEEYEKHAYNAAYENRSHKNTRNNPKKRALTLEQIRKEIFE